MEGSRDGAEDRGDDGASRAPVEGWLGCELAGRYCIESVRLMLGSQGVGIFVATDSWLRRQVLVAIQRVENGNGLASMGRSVARIRNPHVVNVYDCGTYDNFDFVVFERVVTTLSSLHDGARQDWEFSETADAIRSLTLALGDLQESGVDMSHIHPGAVGFVGSGHLKVSPWPFEPTSQSDTWSEVDLASYMLEAVTSSARSETDQLADTIMFGSRTEEGTAVHPLDTLRNARPLEAATGALWMEDMPTRASSASLPTRTPSRANRRLLWLIAPAAAVTVVLAFVLVIAPFSSSTPPAVGADHAHTAASPATRTHAAASKRSTAVVPAVAAVRAPAPATTTLPASTAATPTTVPPAAAAATPATTTTTTASIPTSPPSTTTTVAPTTPTTVPPTTSPQAPAG